MVLKRRLNSALGFANLSGTKLSGAALLGAFLLSGCNNHPVEPLEKTVTAVNRQDNALPAKTKLDFLFVVDNSGSMCQEQSNLTTNFKTISDFLFDELGDAADYRIAVTSTDLRNRPGFFLANPAAAEPAPNCEDEDGDPFIPDTADCAGIDLSPIIKSGKDGNIGTDCAGADDPKACQKADLELRFKCLATLGTQGDSYEKGLEAMRLSLSCDGPNAAMFGECCVAGKYNPSCEIPDGEDGPEFLRPDAILVVTFITDEDDCSDPTSNPSASKLAICKYGSAADGGGVPGGYRDVSICGDLDPAACFAQECGQKPDETSNADWAEKCQTDRCVVSRSRGWNCEWFRDRLTPVDDYYTFLTGLKAEPNEQLLIAGIVGYEEFTEAGNVITYNPVTASADPKCIPDRPEFDFDLYKTEECCPEGWCQGPSQTSCSSSNGEAFAGRRYTELVRQFEINGIGCPGGPDGDEECVHICTDDFSSPLIAIKDRVIKLIAFYCLDKVPACQVPPQVNEAGGVDAARSCETVEEYADLANYPIRVRTQCLVSEDQGGRCAEIVEPRLVPSSEWTLFDAPGCGGGKAIQLHDAPPAGSDVSVEFLVEVSAVRPAAPDTDATVGDAALVAPEADAAQ